MASWKKMVVEDSSAHIAQTSALSDHMKGAAGSRSFTANPEILFQDAVNTTDSFAKGTGDQWLRMNTAANALVWDSLDVAADSGAARATVNGFNIQTENANQYLTKLLGIWEEADEEYIYFQEAKKLWKELNMEKAAVA